MLLGGVRGSVDGGGGVGGDFCYWVSLALPKKLKFILMCTDRMHTFVFVNETKV
jgi:hypothetical protein